MGCIRKKKDHLESVVNFSGLPRPDSALRTLETPAESTLTRPNDFLQAHPLQENQLAVNLPDPHQPLPDNISSHELLTLARGHIQSAQQLVLAASQPFASKGNIIPSHFENAIKLLSATIEHMQNLLKLLPRMLSCPPEPALTRFFASYWEMEVEIYRVKEQAEKFMIFLQRGGDINRRDITQKAARVETILNRLPWYFEDNGFPLDS